MASILPYQSGGDLVFCLIKSGRIARLPKRTAQRPGYEDVITGQVATYPTIALASVAIAQGLDVEWWPG